MSNPGIINKSFMVISNGCDIAPRQSSNNIRELYGIKNLDFLFVFVGSIGVRKNQSQVVEALKILKSNNHDNIKCMFLGGGDIKVLRNKVELYNLTSQAIVIGFVEKERLTDFYNAADATILTSLSEGFGLSIIEGFVYGKPNLIFSDLPAANDLYNENAMLLCPSRDTHKLAECMIEMTSKNWDSNFIKSYSRNFSLEKMADNYIDFYKKTIANK